MYNVMLMHENLNYIVLKCMCIVYMGMCVYALYDMNINMYNIMLYYIELYPIY